MNHGLTSLTLASLLFIAGCCTNPSRPSPEPQVIRQIEYVVKVPSADLMTLPAQAPNIDVDTAKQSDVAKWINAGEKRTRDLENRIIEIAKFLKSEQDALDEKAKTENAKKPTK